MDIEKSSPTIDPCGTPCSSPSTVLMELLIRISFNEVKFRPNSRGFPYKQFVKCLNKACQKSSRCIICYLDLLSVAQ